MSMSPQQMQQMLAMYKQQFPAGQAVPNLTPPPLQGLTQIQQSLGAGAPPGTNKTAGAVNGSAQLIAALMKAQKQKQLQQQLDQQQVNQNMPSTADQNAATSAMTNTMLQQQPLTAPPMGAQ